MHFSVAGIIAIVLASSCYPTTTGQTLKNGQKESGADEDLWDIARQNRITQQILQNFLEKKLFPNLFQRKRPTAWEVSSRVRKKLPQNDTEDWLVSAEERPKLETLQTVESFQVVSLSEEFDDDQDCPNCVDDTAPLTNRWTMPLLKLGEKKYYLGIFFKANYFRATQFCRFHGMHLASISSQEENDKLEKYVKDFGLGHEHFWTSGTDLADEGSFFWMSTGRPLTFTNWNAGEPNNFEYENGEQENCLELWNRDGKGLKWNDSPCSFETFFVCEVQ